MKSNLRHSFILIFCLGIFSSCFTQFYNGNFNIGYENCQGPDGWTTGTDGVQISRLFNNNDNWVDLTGCNSGNGKWIEQQVILTPGTLYSIRMDLGTWSEWDDEDAGVDITIDGIPLGSRVYNDEFSQVKGWRLLWKKELRSCTFIAHKSRVTIRFTGNGRCTKTSPAFKCVSPNPGVIALDNVVLDSVKINFPKEICLLGGQADLKYSFSQNIAAPRTEWWFEGQKIGNGSVQSIDKTGVYTLKLFFECDSVVLQTQVVSVNDEYREIKICQGDSLWLFNRYVKQAGLYIDTVRSTSICKKVIKTNLNYLMVDQALEFKREYHICTLENDSLNLSLGMGYLSYLWYPDRETGNGIIIKKPGNYSVVYQKDSNYCKDSIPFTVYDLCDPISYIPNAFTPNGDGSNDVFPPALNYISNYRIKIYNRWGELLFSGEDPNKGWDGYYKKELCMEGVYVYIIQYRSNRTNKTYNFSGTITLLR